MCGIAGEYNLKCQNVEPEKLKGMNHSIKNRGLDDSGIIFIDSKNNNAVEEIKKPSNCVFDIGLAHRRLSILDLSVSGKQPMTDSDKKIWLVFNGEIYNHQELRGDLEKKGYSFQSSTDTEVIWFSDRVAISDDVDKTEPSVLERWILQSRAKH